MPRELTLAEMHFLVAFKSGLLSSNLEPSTEVQVIEKALNCSKSESLKWLTLVDGALSGNIPMQTPNLLRAIDDFMGNPSLVVRSANHFAVEHNIAANFVGASVDNAVAGTFDLSEIRAQVLHLLRHFQMKAFSTGSKGFFCQGKLQDSAGNRYQGQVMAVLIGSKTNVHMQMSSDVETAKQLVIENLEKLASKTFSNGKIGYYCTFKIAIGSERFQTSIQVVKITK